MLAASSPTELTSLPVLGVGLSLSFELPPDPLQLALQRGRPAFIEYAGTVDHSAIASQVARLRESGVPVLYHPSCLNLCGPWPNPPAWLAAVDAHVRAVSSAWLAQDVSVCFASPQPGYSIQMGWFVPPILNRASLEEAVERVSEVRAVVSAPLLLEPPPVTFKVGDMDILDWMQELVARTDCGLLLDCGHLVSHQRVEGWSLDAALARLDLDRVIELHVAGGVLQQREGREYYVDAHDLPILPETWAVLEALLAVTPNLKAVCLECEGAAAASILPVLHRVRQRVATLSVSPQMRAHTLQELQA